MRSTRDICITLPAEHVPALDSLAVAERRSRSSLVAIAIDEYLLRHGASGRQRLAELERLAQEGIARANRPDPDGSRQAAEAHLAEHRRLCGFTPNEEASND